VIAPSGTVGSSISVAWLCTATPGKRDSAIANTSNMDISFFPIMNILSVNHWISLPKNLTFGQKFYILVTEYHHPHVFSPNILRNVDTISLFWSTI
jgi:hypothetical protein